MASSGEIVTLQVGHLANFVGTHWWNLQEGSFVYDEKISTDINHDTLFREGEAAQGQITFFPRLIAVDLKGSLNSLNEDGNIYNKSAKSSDAAWDGDIAIHKTEPQSKNEFLKDLEKEDLQSGLCTSSDYSIEEEKDVCQVEPSTSKELENEIFFSKSKLYNLDSSVKVWSDYLRVRLHPKAIYLIQEFSHSNSLEPFDCLSHGNHVWSLKDNAEELENKIRFYAEECNLLEGFHLLVDGNNGFTGIGSNLASLLQDEYPSQAVLGIPIYPVSLEKKNAQQVLLQNLNIAIGFEKLFNNCSLITPISLRKSFASQNEDAQQFPFLQYDPCFPYHAGAILAACLDTVTLPYRLKRAATSLHDVTAALSVCGMKASSLSMSFPFPVAETSPSLMKSLNTMHQQEMLQSLTPDINVKGSNVFCQSVTLRGINDLPVARIPEPNNLFQPSRTEDMIGQFLQEIYPNCPSGVKVVKESCFVNAPFPHIFNPGVTSTGYISNENRSPNTGVKSVPIYGGIHCNKSMGDFIKNIQQGISQAGILKKYVTSTDLEMDEIMELSENLQTIALKYEETK